MLDDLKCLVESVARITLDIAGEQKPVNASFEQTVNAAHKLLERQPGRGLADGAEFEKIAKQAFHMAQALGPLRNGFGGGHGRAYRPTISEETVLLAIDGAFTWLRWAVRRVGFFSEGRPEMLIRDLIEQRATFRAGDLRERLAAADIPALDVQHQRALGVAVGERVMEETFVVRWDGLDPCLQSAELRPWTEEYRVGLMNGLWFSREGKHTLTSQSIKDGISVLDPIPDASAELLDQVRVVCKATPTGLPSLGMKDRANLLEWLKGRRDARPNAESVAFGELTWHIELPHF